MSLSFLPTFYFKMTNSVKLKSKCRTGGETYNSRRGMILEFCEKCGAMMLPTKKEDGKRVLKCRECGHERPLTKAAEDYKVEYRIEHSPREKIVVIEESDQYSEEMTEDERRERRKAILEFLEMEDSD